MNRLLISILQKLEQYISQTRKQKVQGRWLVSSHVAS